jgi:hypothetical protein
MNTSTDSDILPRPLPIGATGLFQDIYSIRIGVTAFTTQQQRGVKRRVLLEM